MYYVPYWVGALVLVGMGAAVGLVIVQSLLLFRERNRTEGLRADVLEVRQRYAGLKQASQAIVPLLPDATPRTDSMTMDGNSLERAQARAAEYHSNQRLEPVRQFIALVKDPQTLSESQASYRAAFGPGGSIPPLPSTARELGPIRFDGPPTYEEP